MAQRPDITSILGRLQHVSAGPWSTFQGEDPTNAADYDGPWPLWRGVETPHGEPIIEKCGGDDYTDRILNADFIAAARQDVPDLVAWVVHLETQLAAVPK